MQKIIITAFVSMFGLGVLSAQQYPFKVEIIGEGEPLLFIPGFTCTAEVWEETVAIFSDNYECHVFTLAGFGDVAAIKLPWLPKIKESLVSYIKDKELQSATVIGHSLGGTLGLWMAASESKLFRKLIVVDGLSSVGALMIPGFDSEAITYDNPYSKNILAMDDKAFKTMASQMSSFMSLNEEKHRQITNWILKADRNTYVHGYTDLLKLDLRKEIEKIDIPVILLGATYPDKEQLIANYNKQFMHLKNFKAYYADDSAHFIMYDQPEWFVEHLKKNIK